MALVDALGNLARFVLLPGQSHDLVGVKPLIQDVEFDMFLGDKAFDADWLRTELNERGAVVVIPPKSNRKQKIDCDFHAYRWRQRVAPEDSSRSGSRMFRAAPNTFSKVS